MTRPALMALLVAATACGHKIGDSCSFSSDCSQDGTRVCDTLSPGGYCTKQGCDFNTCPDEAVCIRFFPGLEDAVACAMTLNGTIVADPSVCAADEVCTVNLLCAPVSIEERFCMLSCSSDGDCRDRYECRDSAAAVAACLMMAAPAACLALVHPGEPVPDPSPTSMQTLERPFCAPRRSCTSSSDCAANENCDSFLKVCVPK